MLHRQVALANFRTVVSPIPWDLYSDPLNSGLQKQLLRFCVHTSVESLEALPQVAPPQFPLSAQIVFLPPTQLSTPALPCPLTPDMHPASGRERRKPF